MAIQDTLNSVYRVQETRSFFHARIAAIGLTILLTAIAIGVCAPAALLPTTAVLNQFALGIVLMVLYGALTWRFVLDDTHRNGILEVVRARKLTAIFGRS